MKVSFQFMRAGIIGLLDGDLRAAKRKSRAIARLTIEGRW